VPFGRADRFTAGTQTASHAPNSTSESTSRHDVEQEASVDVGTWTRSFRVSQAGQSNSAWTTQSSVLSLPGTVFA